MLILKNIKDLNLTRLLLHNLTDSRGTQNLHFIISDKNTAVFPIHTTPLLQKATFILKTSEFQKFGMSESIYSLLAYKP